MTSGDGGRTDVIFVPLASLEQPLSNSAIKKFEVALATANLDNDAAVKTLGSQGHVKLREDAIIYSYSHKVIPDQHTRGGGKSSISKSL